MLSLYNDDYLSCINKIDNNSVGLILTDIPYNISKKNGFGGYDKKNNRNRTGIDFGEWDKGFDETGLSNLIPLVKNGGSILIFCSFEQIGTIIEVFSDLELKDKIIWEKTNPFVRNRDRRYISNIEICLWFVKPGDKWVFNRYDETYEGCVLRYPSESGGGYTRYHPTQKNLKLIEYILAIHSNENDTILDPFMGSGTTGVACVNSNRNFIGIEINEEYYNISKSRIEKSYGVLKFT
jgi:site-specific DNA-methyltransferase (adenine-specific)